MRGKKFGARFGCSNNAKHAEDRRVLPGQHDRGSCWQHGLYRSCQKYVFRGDKGGLGELGSLRSALRGDSTAESSQGSTGAAGLPVPNFRRWLGDADLSLDKWPADDKYKEYLERICSSISCRPGEAWV